MTDLQAAARAYMTAPSAATYAEWKRALDGAMVKVNWPSLPSWLIDSLGAIGGLLERDNA